jgi:caa(3)-type oxidase subunit IV
MSGSDDTYHINYLRIWGFLVILLAISVIGPFVGEAFSAKWITLVTAFGIACVKAYLVVANFMHLTFEKRFITYAIVTCLVFMFLFFAGTAPDVMKEQGSGWQKPAWIAANAAAHEPGGAHH